MYFYVCHHYLLPSLAAGYIHFVLQRAAGSSGPSSAALGRPWSARGGLRAVLGPAAGRGLPVAVPVPVPVAEDVRDCVFTFDSSSVMTAVKDSAP